MHPWAPPVRITSTTYQDILWCSTSQQMWIFPIPLHRAELEVEFQKYREMYADYYEKHKHPNSPAMREIRSSSCGRSVGLFSFAKDKQTSRVASGIPISTPST
ncbi:hypothetical protein V8V91_09860 [Algoriphagus halophilus]